MLHQLESVNPNELEIIKCLNLISIHKTIYIAVALGVNGKKIVLGLWLGKNESYSF